MKCRSEVDAQSCFNAELLHRVFTLALPDQGASSGAGFGPEREGEREGQSEIERETDREGRKEHEEKDSAWRPACGKVSTPQHFYKSLLCVYSMMTT